MNKFNGNHNSTAVTNCHHRCNPLFPMSWRRRIRGAGFLTCGSTGLSSPVFQRTGDWKVALTRGQECLRHIQRCELWLQLALGLTFEVARSNFAHNGIRT